MEKRLYRNGWYHEKNKGVSYSRGFSESANENSIEKSDSVTLEKLISNSSKNPEIRDSNPIVSLQNKNQSIQEIKSNSGDPIVKMTYSQARVEMAKKGCQPNEAATNTYYLSLASIISVWFGIGLLLTIFTLFYSVYAINKVIASGDCIEENLAIIKAGRRICWGIIIGMLILASIVIGIILTIISFGNGL